MTRPTILTIDKLAPSDLPAALEAARQVSPLDYLIIDWWNKPGAFARFNDGMSELKAKPGDCIGGGAFGKVVDISWRQVGDMFRVALVAEGDVSALEDAAKSGDVKWEPQADEANRVVNDESVQVILWGTKHVGDDHNPTEPSVWVEGRIPRPLVYPVTPVRMDSKNSKRDFEAVMLHVVSYVDERGRAVVYRRHALRAQLESLTRQQQRLRGEGLITEAVETVHSANYEQDQAAGGTGAAHDVDESGEVVAAAGPKNEEEINEDGGV